MRCVKPAEASSNGVSARKASGTRLLHNRDLSRYVTKQTANCQLPTANCQLPTANFHMSLPTKRSRSHSPPTARDTRSALCEPGSSSSQYTEKGREELLWTLRSRDAELAQLEHRSQVHLKDQERIACLFGQKEVLQEQKITRLAGEIGLLEEIRTLLLTKISHLEKQLAEKLQNEVPGSAGTHDTSPNHSEPALSHANGSTEHGQSS